MYKSLGNNGTVLVVDDERTKLLSVDEAACERQNIHVHNKLSAYLLFVGW